MTLSPINSMNTNVRFCSKDEKTKIQPDKTLSGVPLPGTKRLNYSPVAIGAINGFCWASVGMVLDKFASKLLKSPVNSKISLALNGAFGLFMGYRAYKVAKNEAKQA